MVNTLRITSVVAVIIAALVLLLVAGPKAFVPKLLLGYALQSDEETERILNSPSVVEQWKASSGDKDEGDKNAKPLLVQQAEAFKRIIDPPPKPGGDRNKDTSRTARQTPAPVIKPPVGSAKFTVVGTSYQSDNPAESFAYIQLAGQNTYKWVQIGDEIGHYRVKEIRPDAVVCWDGQSDVIEQIQPLADTAGRLEVGGSAAAAPASSAPVQITPKLNVATESRITGPPSSQPWRRSTAAVGPDAAALKVMSEKDQRARDLVQRMRESGSVEERAARARRLISEFRSPQVSPGEAEELENLGRELSEANEAPVGE